MVRLTVLLLSSALAGASSASNPSESLCHLDGFESPLRCVAIEVPLDYAAMAGKTITITAAIAPALTARPAPDALFVLAGGPGQAGSDLASWLDTAFRPAHRSRDIVLVDFRGTGRSGALGCETPGTFSDSEDLMRQAAAACAARHGPDVLFYSHREVIEDIERLRVALGYEEISVWGGSFGTRAAQHYVRKYGEHVHSVVLDAVTPVGRSIFDTAPRTGETALQRLFSDCKADSACAQAYPELETDLAELLARAETDSIVADVRDPHTGNQTRVGLDRDGIVNLLRGPLYVGLTRAVVPYAITEAALNNFEPLIALGAATGEWSVDTMAFGFTLGILCSEDVAQSAADDPADLSAGFMRDSYYRGFAALCSMWPSTPLAAEMFEPLRSAVPALAISGEADPVTPPSLGEAALAQFAARVHVVVPDGYHTNSSDPCVADIIGAFLTDPAQGGRDHACLEPGASRPRFFLAAKHEELPR